MAQVWGIEADLSNQRSEEWADMMAYLAYMSKVMSGLGFAKGHITDPGC